VDRGWRRYSPRSASALADRKALACLHPNRFIATIGAPRKNKIDALSTASLKTRCVVAPRLSKFPQLRTDIKRVAKSLQTPETPRLLLQKSKPAELQNNSALPTSIQHPQAKSDARKTREMGWRRGYALRALLYSLISTGDQPWCSSFFAFSCLGRFICCGFWCAPGGPAVRMAASLACSLSGGRGEDCCPLDWCGGVPKPRLAANSRIFPPTACLAGNLPDQRAAWPTTQLDYGRDCAAGCHQLPLGGIAGLDGESSSSREAGNRMKSSAPFRGFPIIRPVFSSAGLYGPRIFLP